MHALKHEPRFLFVRYKGTAAIASFAGNQAVVPTMWTVQASNEVIAAAVYIAVMP
jgi:hypothetical protein